MTDTEEKTEFKFDELSEHAKERARENYTSGDYPGYEWWDAIYDDAVRMARLLGIEIGTTTHSGRKPGTTYQTTNIWFSGFCSQGDGAHFAGDYKFAPNAVKDIEQETTDEELLRIATELTLMQLTQRLNGHEYFRGSIFSDNSNCIRTEIYDWGIDEVGEPGEEDFKQLMQDFADWIYKRLEDEYDYLCSDEYVDERLSENDCVFDEDGHTI